MTLLCTAHSRRVDVGCSRTKVKDLNLLQTHHRRCGARPSLTYVLLQAFNVSRFNLIKMMFYHVFFYEWTAGHCELDKPVSTVTLLDEISNHNDCTVES